MNMTSAAAMLAFSTTMYGACLAAPWSPDGTLIAYSYIGGPENLYIVNADGAHQRDLVVRGQRDFRPEWSPDGSHILFTSVVDDKHIIIRVNPDGTGLKQLSEPEEAAGGADYAPDGTITIRQRRQPQQVRKSLTTWG